MPEPFKKRLSEAWRVLLGRSITAAPAPTVDTAAEEARLSAQAAAAAARLEAEEARQMAAALRRELDAERASRDNAIEAALQARLEPALDDAATIIGQLALQARLIEQGKPVGARDVMALASRLAKCFEKLGLVPLDKAGDQALFDSTRHQPMGGFSPEQGAPVAIKIPGCRLGQRILKKSIVEPVNNENK